MNDNSFFPNNESEREDFPSDALSDYPDYPFREPAAQETSSSPAESAPPPVDDCPIPIPREVDLPTQEQPPEPPGTGPDPRMSPERLNRDPYSHGPAYQAPSSAPVGGQPESRGYDPYHTPYYGRPAAPYSGGEPYGAQRQSPPQGGYAYPPNRGYGPPQNGYPYMGSPYGAMPPSPPPNNPNPKKAPKKKKKSFNWMLALLIIGCILIGTVSGIVISGGSRQSNEPPTQSTDRDSESQPTENHKPTVTEPSTNPPRETQPLATSSGEQMTLNQIYTSNVPAIVGITNEFTQTVFGQTSTAASSGSGFIITSDGEILTNYHVVEGAERLIVTLNDGREYPATLIGYEAESDVALIKIDAENLPVCAIGNSDAVYVGEQIAAIGNPMGELTYTMTVGYVSAMDRFVNTDGTPISMIQVDAAINPGNSGGPVFNLYGEVIGIATAKYSGTLSDGATLEGLGFAIPINDIVEILNDLRVNGKVPDRAYMGVMVSMLPLDKETFGIDYGVYVQSVDEGGSAYKAGVQAEDIILKIGDVELNAYENLQQTLRKFRAGDETTITVYRDGETITMPIVFDAKPDTTEPVTPTEPANSTEPESTENPWETFPWGDFPWGDFGG